MPPLTLEGDTLGERRRHYNKLVEDAVADKHYVLSSISADDNDIDNLLKIDIACKTRNVNYILEVMKSNDMLYAATAIKKSTWLITEQQYANIINPEYLHTQLLPNMNTKTFNKLMLHIRLNLKDEARVETFYEYLKQSDSAYKWLEHCSIPFIENVIKNERLIPLSLFKRLCRRSAHFLTYYKRVVYWQIYDFNKKLIFLMKSHTDQYFNFMDEQEHLSMSGIGKKRSKILLKTHSQKIFDKFEKYEEIIDASVAAKYLKKKEIKKFMFKKIKKSRWCFTQFEKLKHFVKNMPDEEKLEFIRQTFIDRTDLTFLRAENEKEYYKIDGEFYQWYEFIPFNVAFPELKKLILAENSPTERCAMLSVLIKCARKNPQHIKTLLQFSKDRHINEPFNFKIQFVNNLLSEISTHEYDVETWNVLDQLFHSMEVYAESEENLQVLQQCLQSIVLYKVLHVEPVPDIVEQKMEFDTFENFQKILNQEESDKIFAYILNSLMKKIRINSVTNESDFDVNTLHLKNVLTVLTDWRKDISCYPLVLEKFQELVKIKQQNSWKMDPELYNIKKTWRKHMFEESLSLCLNEEACLNALKHKPQLLMRYDKEIDTLRTDDAVSLPRLLAKLRVYWPHSLAQHWVDAYLLHLNEPTGQKAVIKGLFALLPQNQIINLAKKHAPNSFNINWGETDQISVQKNIAKHLHVARPVIPLDAVLWYAKGHYLHYAVPSLNAIVSKMSQVESHNFVLKLLEAPVSLRKLGIHFVISKFKPSEMKTLILNIWNSTTNSIIRAVIFKNTYHRLCKVKNTTVEKELWALLSMFIDTLTKRENKVILMKYLVNREKIPSSVQGEFYMKSFTYLTSLPQNYKRDRLVAYFMIDLNFNLGIVDSFDDDFVTSTFLSPAGTKFCSRDSDYIEIFGRFVLWGKTEEDQLQRFRKVIDPAMEEAFVSWHKTDQGDYYVKKNFEKFIEYLTENLKDFTLSRQTTPAKLFTEIRNNIEKNLELEENYVTYTSWKLVTEYAKLMQQHICEMGDAWLTGEKEKLWNDIHVAMYPALASQIVKCLKEDIDQYFPSICLMFAEAFDKSFARDLDAELEILNHMLIDSDFKPSYIVVSRATIKTYSIPESLKKIRNEIRKKLESHPSQEVQMHYYHDFENSPPEEIDE